MKLHRAFAALEEIRRKNSRRVLQPKAVVDAARDKTSPLHRYFEWNNGKAAEAYRIQQARELIVRVTVINESAGTKPIQAYISLPTTRTKRGGGYHQINDVLTSAQLRNEMLQSALIDLENFQERYNRLKELAEVFAAAKKVRIRVTKKAA